MQKEPQNPTGCLEQEIRAIEKARDWRRKRRRKSSLSSFHTDKSDEKANYVK